MAVAALLLPAMDVGGAVPWRCGEARGAMPVPTAGNPVAEALTALWFDGRMLRDGDEGFGGGGAPISCCDDARRDAARACGDGGTELRSGITERWPLSRARGVESDGNHEWTAMLLWLRRQRQDALQESRHQLGGQDHGSLENQVDGFTWEAERGVEQGAELWRGADNSTESQATRNSTETTCRPRLRPNLELGDTA